MSIVISDEYGKRVDYGKYKIYYVHGRTDEERQFIVFPERREKMFTFQSRIRKKFTV